mgnify:FL=1
MNKYAKEFLHRGLMFGGFGPVVAGIVLACIPAVRLSGGEVLLAILSTYALAFIHAGASVFNQIEHWSMAKSLLCHFGCLYLAYSLCYLVNSWIPFEPMVLVIFTAVFAAVYFVVWGIVYACIRSAEKKMNRHLG